MAPDSIVYINGETDIIGCATCKRRFDFGKYITQIQTSLDIDSVPGSATINLSVPRHVVDDFYMDGVPVISPMMEVEIFSKGFYLLEGIPQYYPTFWGLITEVSDSYSNGEHTVTLSCADILKWWEICRMNVNPAFTAPTPSLGRSIFGNVLFGTNPYDLIFTLAQMSFGDVILGTGSLVSLYKEAGQKATFNAALGDIMSYWSQRFSRIRSNLLLYGVNGIAIRGDSVAHSYEQSKFTPTKGLTPVANAVRNANGGPLAAQLAFDPTDPDVTAFRTQFSQAGEVNFWQSEYQTKLEIANACKEAIGFEFYMDVTGDIVFKPPFYNLDILSNKPVSWIQDIDIIDWDFSESEAEVVTQLTIQGSYGGNVDYGFGPEITPFTSVTDYHLLRQYGWRPHTFNSEFMGDLTRMFYHGMDILDRLNSRRHQGTVTIPFRPELRLGFPVYIAPKDQVWYIKGISHSIAFGGRATTSLTLTARRQKFVAIQGISTLKTKGDASEAYYEKALAEFNRLAPEKKKGKSPPKKPTPSGKIQGPPTIRQLRDRAFALEMGDAATIPPIGMNPDDPKTSEPYKPLLLRHPKTGKVVGYPNVVMVYTRPYDGKKGYEAIAGEKKAGSNKQAPKATKAQTEQRQKAAREEAKKASAFGRTEELQGKYSHNRYSYGLNSAGVYVYAHDVDKSVTQFALIPSKNIVVSGGDSPFTEEGIKLETPTSMVRPVSDERGFEVIGHFRYGRGVSLRDGSLVYNEGQNNQQTEIGAQLALGGDLFATLTAQSQGLTSVITAYPNPADAVARLMPEDLQSAGTWTMENGVRKFEFANTGTNFVDSAPLGSAEAKGVPPSVEAGQLSRALTLAEMTVRSELVPGDPDCPCQTGRADLTFINVGYQVKTINPSSPVLGDSLYGNRNAGGNEFQADGAGSGGAAADGSINFDYHSISAEDSAGSQSYYEAPVKPPTLKASEAIERVEKYLMTLYQALDTPHQDFEKSLRGDPSGFELQGEISGERQVPDLFTGAEGDPEQGNFSPPFSSPNRSNLGDPVATAQQASSAMGDLKQSFSDFGDNLKKNTKKAQLKSEINALTAKIDRLKKRQAMAIASSGSGSVTILGKDDPEELQKQIDAAEQDRANKEAELALLG